MYSKKFINNGFLHIKNNKTFVNQCSDLNKLIKKNLIVSSKIFLTKQSYLKNKKHIKTGDILSKVNIDFVLNNSNIKKTLESVIGKNYKLVSKRVIYGIPAKYLPKHLTKKENIRSINLGHFIKKNIEL